MSDCLELWHIMIRTAICVGANRWRLGAFAVLLTTSILPTKCVESPLTSERQEGSHKNGDEVCL